RVHPDVRIIPVSVDAVIEQLVLGERFGERDDWLALGETPEEVFELRLEIQAMPENGISLRHGDDIRAGLPVRMWSGARAHERRHLDAIAADMPQCVSDHAGGGDDVEFLLRRCGWYAAGSPENNGQQTSCRSRRQTSPLPRCHRHSIP